MVIGKLGEESPGNVHDQAVNSGLQVGGKLHSHLRRQRQSDDGCLPIAHGDDIKVVLSTEGAAKNRDQRARREAWILRSDIRNRTDQHLLGARCRRQQNCQTR
jgi:hypothetical protein